MYENLAFYTAQWWQYLMVESMHGWNKIELFALKTAQYKAVGHVTTCSGH